MYHSMTSISSEDDPWKAGCIGIKCISYKPIGYLMLTRRVLDLFVTDGKRKIEVLYNYSRRYKDKIKVPSIGTAMSNCSFCDTITIDLDPDSTFFDLVMEVQIITQGATLDRHLKVSSDGNVEREGVINPVNVLENEFVENVDENENDDDEFSELTSIKSNYDYRYKKNNTIFVKDPLFNDSNNNNNMNEPIPVKYEYITTTKQPKDGKYFYTLF
jgi:hypothetical protein